MTSKERVLRMLDHKEADRIPKYDSFWDETMVRYYSEGLPRDLDKNYRKIELSGQSKTIGSPLGDYFGYDLCVFSLDNSMRFPPQILEETDTWQIFADRCGYKAKKNRGLSTLDFIEHVCPDETAWLKHKNRFTFDPQDTSRIDSEPFFLRMTGEPSWSEAKTLFDLFRQNEAFYLFSGYGPYEGTWRHHGYTESLMDVLSEPKLMFEMFEAITDLTIEILKHAVSIGMKPDGYWMVEDLGCTRSTLFSPQTYRELLYPHHKRLGDYLHREGIRYFVHSCGKIDVLLPDFIRAGIEVVQPLQANTGMNVLNLKKEFGQDLTFWGNIDERALAGSFAEIEREIGSKIPEAMKGGGYIYHSDHSIPPTVSLENYRYAMKMVEKYGTY